MTEWKLTDNRVHGHGQNYTLHNKITAKQLHNTLNNYEKTIQLHTNLEQQFDKIQKQLIQTNLSLNILKDDMEKLTTQLQQVKE